MSGSSLDVTGPSRTRVVNATRSVKRRDATHLGGYRPNARLSSTATSPVPRLCPAPPSTGSVRVRDFRSCWLPDHTRLTSRPTTKSPFGPSRFFETTPPRAHITHPEPSQTLPQTCRVGTDTIGFVISYPLNSGEGATMELRPTPN